MEKLEKHPPASGDTTTGLSSCLVAKYSNPENASQREKNQQRNFLLQKVLPTIWASKLSTGTRGPKNPVIGARIDSKIIDLTGQTS